MLCNKCQLKVSSWPLFFSLLKFQFLKLERYVCIWCLLYINCEFFCAVLWYINISVLFLYLCMCLCCKLNYINISMLLCLCLSSVYYIYNETYPNFKKMWNNYVLLVRFNCVRYHTIYQQYVAFDVCILLVSINL